MELEPCEDLRKNLQSLVFNELESENHIPGAVCDEPNLTSSTSPLIIDEATSPDNTMDAPIPTSTSTLVIDDPMSSDITDDTPIPKLVIDETTSPAVTQFTLRRSERIRKRLKKLNF